MYANTVPRNEEERSTDSSKHTSWNKVLLNEDFISILHFVPLYFEETHAIVYLPGDLKPHFSNPEPKRKPQGIKLFCSSTLNFFCTFTFKESETSLAAAGKIRL